MSLIFIAFLAGILSVLAPCVLPILPVILGGSLAAVDRKKPLVIILSAVVCIIGFTLLLKVSSLLINIPQEFRVYFSAAIIFLYGLTLTFPHQRETLSYKIGLYKANNMIGASQQKGGVRGDILLGASLGPIFASCSPTYAILLSVVFPQNFNQGLISIIVYGLGFGLLLLAIAYGGRALVGKLRRAANPNGRFKKVLGILLLLTGLLIATGAMQKLQVALLSGGLLDATRLEQGLLKNSSLTKKTDDNRACFTSETGQYSCDTQPSQNTPLEVEKQKLLNENYIAPEFAGLQNRINTTGRQSIKELRGKVVVIDFWTYSCINCIRTLPYLTKLDETYKDKGLIIIGVHAPEFQFEKNIDNVKEAVEKFGIKYPVVQDNNFTTRRNYDNLYWPAKYIIDKEGNVRYTHFGEGKYEETEEVIQYLLGIDTGGVLEDETNGRSLQQTPETYLGTSRRASYSKQATEKLHAWWLEGDWKESDERIELTKGSGSISINAYAKEANLVLGAEGKSIGATVYVDGKEYKKLTIKGYELYNLLSESVPAQHTIELKFDSPGVMAYAYTFG